MTVSSYAVKSTGTATRPRNTMAQPGKDADTGFQVSPDDVLYIVHKPKVGSPSTPPQVVNKMVSTREAMAKAVKTPTPDMEDEVRRREQIRRRDEDIRRLDEIRRLNEDIRRRGEEMRRRGEEMRRRGDEARRIDETRRIDEETRRIDEETRREVDTVASDDSVPRSNKQQSIAMRIVWTIMMYLMLILVVAASALVVCQKVNGMMMMAVTPVLPFPALPGAT